MEGVDFHCSSVLESAILSNTNLVQECYDQLEGIMNMKLNHHKDDKDAGCRRSWLEGVLKSCMWKYSAGVNLRLPLIVDLLTHDGNNNTIIQDNSDNSTLDDKDMKGFYQSMISPRTKAFGERYIDDRLLKR